MLCQYIMFSNYHLNENDFKEHHKDNFKKVNPRWPFLNENFGFKFLSHYFLSNSLFFQEITI